MRCILVSKVRSLQQTQGASLVTEARVSDLMSAAVGQADAPIRKRDGRSGLLLNLIEAPLTPIRRAGWGAEMPAT